MNKEIIEIVIFVEEILRYFSEKIKGVYSDIVWYELLGITGAYLEKNDKDFEEYLEFNLNIEKEGLKEIKKNYIKRLKEVKEYE